MFVRAGASFDKFRTRTWGRLGATGLLSAAGDPEHGFMTVSDNPLIKPWTGPFEAPPFALIEAAHFRPAFDAALKQSRDEIAAIAANPAPATFDNTIAALERSGRALARVSAVFFNLARTDGTPETEAIEREVASLLARRRSEIFLDPRLYARVDALQTKRDTLGLTPEQERALERYHVAFTRAGAGLGEAPKRRLAEIAERLAALEAQFGQNVLADEKSYLLVLDGPRDLEGLPDWLVASSARTAADRGLAGKHAITLARSSVEPFLQFSPRRDLRERAFTAWAARGEPAGEGGNREIMNEIVKLRAERASLMGYESFARFRLADTMAKTPARARELLDSVWTRALKRAAEEEASLQEIAAEEGGNFKITPYLQLDKMIEAAFYVAGRLFGLRFVERFDAPLYNSEARAWTVHGPDGAEVALFIGDYFARSSKRSGAWSSAFRKQEKLDGAVRPIVVNVLNLAKPREGAPALLSFEEAKTLFHEFGHALHAMLSNVTYPLLSGTSVATDFVEFPSQIYERWLGRPEVLRRFALHHETGAPMPEALIGRLDAARTFNQGFATVEYAASALVDLELHARPDAPPDVALFERRELQALGCPDAIPPRHRAAHFQHIFGGESYAAGYYSYLWSEVLDADGFEAFEERGDVFDSALAKRLAEFVYSAGNLRDPEIAYASFRGRAPKPDALLRTRGLAGAAA